MDRSASMALPIAYSTGRTAAFACQADQRFSYCLYVPEASQREPASTRMLVAVHDSLRDNQSLRDRFAGYAEETNTLVLAPLFPAGIEVASDVDNYKYLRFRDIRFDQIVLSMVSEVAARHGVSDARFDLFGFSGGAHFAHRFVYVQPRRLDAVVVASPGSVTLPTEDYAWWPGLADFASIFGRAVDWEAVRRVAVHLVVGADDVDPNGIVRSKDNPNWRDGADVAGANRVERLRSLHRSLCAKDVPATFEELPGVAHQVGPVVDAAIRYLRSRQRPPGAAS